MRRAADTGFRILSQGGSALDAVEGAVVSLEDNPLFNAGTGSTLNLLGDIETDAGIMDGRTLRGGAVALLRGIRNPIKAARVVMEKTDHVLIAGNPARKLALANGGQKADLRVGRRVSAWKTELRQLKRGTGPLPPASYELFKSTGRVSDTVGAVCLDIRGDVAAADSTGGMSLKLPGRIGDSPILGAGLYADIGLGAATATGVGEQAMRLLISKLACDMMKRRYAAQAAVDSIRYATGFLGKGLGIITLDRMGRYGVSHNTPNLCWAVKTTDVSSERMSGRRVPA